MILAGVDGAGGDRVALQSRACADVQEPRQARFERGAEFRLALAVLRAGARRIGPEAVERQFRRILPAPARNENRAPVPEAPRVVAALHEAEVPDGVHTFELCVAAVIEPRAHGRTRRDALARLDAAEDDGQVLREVEAASLIRRRHTFQDLLDAGV